MENLQAKIIQLCSERLEKKKLVHILMEKLHLSRDAAYRRMRGDTLFNIEEIAIICETFDISFDQLIVSGENQVSFRFRSLYEDHRDIFGFFAETHYFMKIMANSQDCHLTLAAMDLPIFRQLSYPHLTKFMIFYWQKTVLHKHKFKNLKFDMYEIEEGLLDLLQEIAQSYYSVSSTEIWSPETITSTLKRIEYYHISGFMGEAEDTQRVLQDIRQLLQQLKEESERGMKKVPNRLETKESPINFYLSEVYLSNNIFQVEMNDRSYTYLSYNSINSLMSSSPKITKECSQWIAHIKANSVLLSQVSQRHRLKFFNNLELQIDNLCSKHHLN